MIEDATETIVPNETPATPEVAPTVEAPAEPSSDPVTETKGLATEGFKFSKGAKIKAAALVPETPAWIPDWKYKFNGQEREVDEFFRPLAKDAQALEKVKDMIQRAEAVEMHKTKTKEYETQLSEVKPEIETVAKLRGMYDRGDHERVLANIGYTDDMLMKIVKDKLDRHQLAPEQKAQYESEQRLRLDNEKLLADNEMYRSQAAQELTNVTGLQLESELGKVEHQAIKEAYEKAHGDGSFKALVLDRGAYLVDRAQKHVSPSEVMASVLKEFGPFVTQVQNAAVGTPEVQTQQKPKIIPNVGRGGGSPALSRITSIDQLKQLQKQFR